MTAVEWLEDLYYPNYIPKEIFEQAKKMEKQQIKDAFKDGQFDAIENEALGKTEKYFNETFKK